MLITVSIEFSYLLNACASKVLSSNLPMEFGQEQVGVRFAEVLEDLLSYFVSDFVFVGFQETSHDLSLNSHLLLPRSEVYQH